MHTHFDQHLNLRKIILENRPSTIVECGAGDGACTRLLSHLQWYYPFNLHVISDKEIDGLDKNIHWKTGLSYNVLKEFKDNSIDMCIIDTDHNYWTLVQELLAVKNKMTEGGLIVFHDVDEFYHNTGMAMSYWNGEPYPEQEIKKHVSMGGLGDALLRFLVEYNSEFKLVQWVKESYGAAVIQKKTVNQTCIIMPGDKPVFAKPVEKEAASV